MSHAPTSRERVEAAFRLGRALRLVYQASPRWTLINAALVVLQGALPLAALYVFKRILDAVLNAVSAPGRPELVSDVWMWVVVAAGVGLSTAVARSWGEYATQAQSLQVTDAVAETLHGQSIAVDLAYYEDPSYYDTLHRAQAEAAYRPMRIVSGLTQTAQNGLAAAGIVVWLASLNWVFALMLCLGVLPGVLVRLAQSRNLYKLQQAQTEAQRRSWYYHEVLTDALHAKELRIFNLGAIFQSRYREQRQAIRGGALAVARRYVAAELTGQLISTLALFGFVGWVAMRAVSGAVTIGDLAVYYLGFQSGLTLLQAVLRSLAGLYEDNLFLTNLYAFLDIKPTVTAPREPQPVPRPIIAGVVFHDVAFRYPGHATDAVRQVNLTVAPGEVVALVGENGSGKTTLAKLLCRLYDPARGHITVDGIDLRSLDPVRWRREIAVTFQDYVRYALTAGENIWIGDVDHPPEAASIAAAARQSGADSVIARLPDGYDTQLGRLFQEGQELSGGEWQRIAMARAFWRQGSIVVLDEPSSALDPLAEAELLRQFRHLLGGRSAIVISHRLAAVQMADRICVLDRGSIVESGTHASLLEDNGQYARMYRAQAQPYQD